MSLQVNLSSPAIRTAYEKVLDGIIDYVVLSYKKFSNDLNVTAATKGTLDDLVEEFSDGKVQYALARVSDPNTHLPKFVLINWCGEGVPENRKGLFPPHSATVADYFKVYHVSIQARSEDDILPDAILRKVMDSSGSKYGTASSRAPEPIAPVGTTHKPVGTPDIRGMQAKAPKPPKNGDTPGPVGTNYTPAREELKMLREGKLTNPAPPSVLKPSMPQPSKPQPSSAPKSAPEPAPAPPKPTDEDKIQPVGTSYSPVSLPKPGKLSLDRTMPFSQTHQPTAPAPPGRRAAVPGKLTWSQRQEKARQEREAEEAQAESAHSVDHVVSQMNRASVDEVPPAPPAPESTAPSEPPASGAPASGRQRATVLYDYDAGEDNELTLREGEILTGVDQVDEGWWSATGPNGATGLFPANYVELMEEAKPEAEQTLPPPPPPAPPAPPASEPPAEEQAPPPPPPPPAPPAPPAPEPPAEEQAPPPPPPPPAPPAPPAPEPPTEEQVPPPPPPPPAPPAPPAPEPEAAALPPPPPPAPSTASPQAVALYDYEMDEDNEITLAEGDQIVDIEFPSEDWWSGTNARTGATGLFPANYVERLS